MMSKIPPINPRKRDSLEAYGGGASTMYGMPSGNSCAHDEAFFLRYLYRNTTANMIISTPTAQPMPIPAAAPPLSVGGFSPGEVDDGDNVGSAVEESEPVSYGSIWTMLVYLENARGVPTPIVWATDLAWTVFIFSLGQGALVQGFIAQHPLKCRCSVSQSSSRCSKGQAVRFLVNKAFLPLDKLLPDVAEAALMIVDVESEFRILIKKFSSYLQLCVG